MGRKESAAILERPATPPQTEAGGDKGNKPPKRPPARGSGHLDPEFPRPLNLGIGRLIINLDAIQKPNR